MATCLPYKLAWVPIISICKEKAKTTSPTVCLLITSDTMADIKRVLGKQPKTYHNIMIWQLAVLHSFSQSHHPTSMTLTFTCPWLILQWTIGMPLRQYNCTLRSQKQLPFRQGAFLHLGRTNNNVHPVKAIMSYLARPVARGVLQVWMNRPHKQKVHYFMLKGPLFTIEGSLFTTKVHFFNKRSLFSPACKQKIHYKEKKSTF